jgi:hypothetical protein
MSVDRGTGLMDLCCGECVRGTEFMDLWCDEGNEWCHEVYL